MFKTVGIKELAERLGLKPPQLRRLLRRHGVDCRWKQAVEIERLKEKLGEKWLLLEEVLAAGGRFLRLSNYCRKYSISQSWGTYLWRLGFVRGVRLSPKIVLVEDIPYERATDAFLDEDALYERIAGRLRKQVGMPVALVRVGVHSVGRRGLTILAKRGLLFRVGRFYYALYDTMGRSIHELKFVYPDPNLLLVPRLARSINWDDVVPVALPLEQEEEKVVA